MQKPSFIRAIELSTITFISTIYVGTLLWTDDVAMKALVAGVSRWAFLKWQV